MGLWQRYLNWRHRHVAALLVTPDGFAVRHGRDSRACRWNDVERITAFKRDLLTYDCVCLLIQLRDGIVEVDEEMKGYPAFRDAMERQFSIPADWWMKVAFPAFEVCACELYARLESGRPC